MEKLTDEDWKLVEETVSEVAPFPHYTVFGWIVTMLGAFIGASWNGWMLLVGSLISGLGLLVLVVNAKTNWYEGAIHVCRAFKKTMDERGMRLDGSHQDSR